MSIIDWYINLDGQDYGAFIRLRLKIRNMVSIFLSLVNIIDWHIYLEGQEHLMCNSYRTAKL